STKNETIAAASTGSSCARSTVTPLTKLSAPGERILTLRAAAIIAAAIVIEASLEREVHDDRHDHGDRFAVQQRRFVRPLPHGVERRLVQQRHDGMQHPRILNPAVRTDCRLDQHGAMRAQRQGTGWIDGLRVPDLSRRLETGAGPYDKRASLSGLGRARAANHAAGDATGHAASHAAE